MAEPDDRFIAVRHCRVRVGNQPQGHPLEAVPPEDRKQWESLWEKIVSGHGHSGDTRQEAGKSASSIPAMLPYLWRWNASDGLITVLPTLLHDLGYFECDTGIHFDSWDRLVHPVDSSIATEAFDARIKGKTSLYSAAHRLRMASGRWYPVLAHEMQCEPGPEGKPSWLMGVFIPQVNKNPVEWLEDQLAQSQGSEIRVKPDINCATDVHNLMNFVGSTNLYHVFVMDTFLRYSWMNDLLQFQLQCPLSRSLGRTDEEVFGERSDRRLQEACRSALNGRAMRTVFTWPIGNDLHVFEGVFVAMRDHNGNPVCVYGISTLFLNMTDMSVLSADTDLDVRSRAMRETLTIADTVADKDTTVLLLGETGTGKDWLAKWIHDHSERRDGPFRVVDCSAIPSGLLESELFGYEPGAHDKAKQRKRGLLEVAEGGTLLLDEIGEMPMPQQVKLLRFVQTKKFNRLGAEKEVEADVRIMAATNRDLRLEIAEGRFREDLFYRLNVFPVTLPPLRERLADLPWLVEEIASDLAEKMKLTEKPFIDLSVLQMFSQYSWPGNVRELSDVLERAMILSGGGPITPDLFDLRDRGAGQEVTSDSDLRGSRSTDRKVSPPANLQGDTEFDLVREIFHSLSPKEQGYYLDIMVNQLCEGQSGAVTCVAELLKMSQKTVKSRLKLVTDKNARTGNPGRWAIDRIVAKLKKYLVDEFLKQTR